VLKNYEEIGHGIDLDLLTIHASHVFHILGEVAYLGKQAIQGPIYFSLT
jgi:hypothetical protein